MSHATACIDIDQQVAKIKNDVFTKKKLLSSLFENKTLILDEMKNNITINNWLAKQILIMETFDTNQDKYVYWVAGGLSWNDWYDTTDRLLYSREEQISMRTGNYEIRYIYYNDANELLVRDKMKTIYNIILKLQRLLLTHGLNTTIKTTNFNYDGTGFVDNNKKPNKKTYNIKLVLNEIPLHQGGARKPRKANRSVNLKQSRPLANLLLKAKGHSQPVVEEEIYDKYRSELLNKTIVEFNFEVFKQSQASIQTRTTELFSTDLFKQTYLKIAPIGYVDGDNYYTIESKLNKLNGLGLITYSYLNTSDKEENLGLNVDLYRQTLFFEKELKNDNFKIANYFKSLILNTYYKLFKNTNFFNLFFVEKINQIIYKYSAINDTYAQFVDYVERWLMSIFRPAINSFIREINEELMPLGVVLFIAGGDAMRRRDFNISSTKDIDTKLYIGHKKQEYIAKNDISGYEEFKKEIKLIIVNHIVKLRNYLEANFRKLFKITTLEIDQDGIKKYREIDYSGTPLVFTNTHTKESFDLFFVSHDKENQHFRTREIRQSERFPVDLFSIDYNAIIKKSNSRGSKDITLNISLLDVVLQEDDFDVRYYEKVENDIPIASLSFLEYDLYLTYTTEERAVARISSGKYKKDIQRYKTLCAIDQSVQQSIIYDFRDISAAIEQLLLDRNIDANVATKFYIIIYKLENKITFTIFDVLICIQLIPFLSRIPQETLNYNIIKKLIEDIAYFRVNIYNENLNKIIMDGSYGRYKIEDDIDEINKNYLELFRKLVEANDGEQKHYINYNNTGIKRLFNQYNIGKSSTKPSRSAPKPRKATAASSRTAPKPRATPSASAPVPVAKATPVFVPPSATSRTTRRGTVFGNP
jgi:hypothetical protein